MPDNSKPILIIRLGAMGDIIHALPAAASLKSSFPSCRVVWVAAHKWLSLLEGNPYLDEIVSYERGSVAGLAATWRRLRLIRPGIAVDLQGLVQSAIIGKVACADEFIGLDKRLARESAASYFYTKTVDAAGPHRVQRCLQLAAATGANTFTEEAWLPAGREEGKLPDSPFVLANPFAGWVSKQWPLNSYAELATRLRAKGILLVVNVPESRVSELKAFPDLYVHTSSISGLIYATRHASKVVGVDSGPLHIAAALKKPGVAIFGPTDPAQTGPFNSPMKVLRIKTRTTYKRESEVHDSMKAITVEQVASALLD